MAGLLDVFKGKGDDQAAPAVAVTGEVSGSRPGSSPSNKGRNASAVDSPAASYARERAAAARAQIEARKAMEESRKNSSNPGKPDINNDKKEENNNKPVGLKAPIRRPPSASINHAQAVAAQKEEQRRAAAGGPANNNGKDVAGNGTPVTKAFNNANKSAATIASEKAKLEYDQAKEREHLRNEPPIRACCKPPSRHC